MSASQPPALPPPHIHQRTVIPNSSLIRLTILCAQNLTGGGMFNFNFKFSLPDAYCTIECGSQSWTTEPQTSLNPVWRWSKDVYVSKGDTITITCWNKKKEGNKGLIGSVKIPQSSIKSLRNKGYQRVNLQKIKDDGHDVKGELILSLLTRDSSHSGQRRAQNNVVMDNQENTNPTTSSPTITTTTSSSPNREAVPPVPIRTAASLPHPPPPLPSSDPRRRDPTCERRSQSRTRPTSHFDRNARSSSSRGHKADRRVPETNTTNSNPNLTMNESTDSVEESPHPTTSSSHLNQSSPHVRQSSTSSHNQATTSSSSIRSPAPPPFSTSTDVLNSSGTAAVPVDNGSMVTTPPTLHPRRSTRSTCRSSRHSHPPPISPHSPPTPVTLRHYPVTSRVLASSSNQNPNPLPESFEQFTTPQGQIMFRQKASGLTTWNDPRVSKELLSMDLNLDQLIGPLPLGWEKRVVGNDSTKTYFVNHNNRTTQFTDPRLVANHEILQSLLLGGTQLLKGDGLDMNLNQRVITSRKNFIQKVQILREKLIELQPSSGHIRLEVNRSDMFEESYRTLMKMKTKELRKKLNVKFRGEEGIDYGGIAREWVFLLSKEMLNPCYGLFKYTQEDIYTLQINPDSSINPDHLSYFHFVGRVLGLALFHGHYIGGHFSLPFYKMLLARPITLDDIKQVDPELHRSLQWTLDNDITDVLDSTFSVDHDSFGKIQVLDLIPNGRNIPVTQENKVEYVRLYVNYHYKSGIESQFQTLQKGFYEVVPPELLISFEEMELELLIGGFGKIDLHDWRIHTRLKHCTSESKIIKWFWEVVQGYSEDMRSKLLQFVTGSPRVPLQGFKALQGTTGASEPRLFTINLVDTGTDNLPAAHTCFNRIDIPPYESKDKLQEKLTQAIEETDAFALD